MISTPICPISHQVSSKLCINISCSQSPLICNNCDACHCQLLHYHDGVLKVIRWSQLQTKLLENMKNFLLQSNLNEIQKQINQFIDNMKNIIQKYIKFVQGLNQSTKLNQVSQAILNKMKDKKWGDITGKQIKWLYDEIKSVDHQKNQHEPKFFSQTQCIIQLLKSMKQTLHNYQKAKNKNIYKNWSKEDQQNLIRYSAIILQYPTAEKYNERGFLYYKNNEFDNAMEDYDKAIQLDSKLIIAYHNRGLIYQDKKQLQKALMEYDKAVQYNPKNPICYINRGMLYIKMNQIEKALKDYNEGIECDFRQVSVMSKRDDYNYKKEIFQQCLQEHTKQIYENKLKWLQSQLNRGQKRVLKKKKL